jgi:Chaperone for flagella basal body P-ring formation
MKSSFILAITVAAMIFAVTVQAPADAARCANAAIRSDVEISSDQFFLSDLLSSGASAALRRAASLIRLGDTPLTGSPRVFEGTEIRVLLNALMKEEPPSRCRSWSVPERITVRRAGDRASCIELIERMRPMLSVALAGSVTPGDVYCGAAGRIAQDVSLEVAETTWNSRQSSWEIRVRCTRASDCVPFLLRVNDIEARPPSDGSNRLQAVASRELGNGASTRRVEAVVPNPVVRPGQTLMLIWDGVGIRVSVPVLCLDPGEPGQQVRARIVRGGLVLRAIVIDAETLRAIS